MLQLPLPNVRPKLRALLRAPLRAALATALLAIAPALASAPREAAATVAAHAAFEAAARTGDAAVLTGLAGGEGYAALLAATELSRGAAFGPAERAYGYERMLALRVDDPLEREAGRALWLEYGRLLEALGRGPEAVAAYAEALPERDAILGIGRLEPDRVARARILWEARLARDTLDALGDEVVPSLLAPAYGGVGDDASALAMYREWARLEPGSYEARRGIAWSLWRLGRVPEAVAAFEELGGPSGAYGLALAAQREGDLRAAFGLLVRTGDPVDIWTATTMAEEQGWLHEALDAYLALAREESHLADDAAYRALVLAGRVGSPEAGEAARGLIPAGSFFDLKLGGDATVPTLGTLPDAVGGFAAKALAAADALLASGREEAAAGELLLALRAAPDEAALVAIGERLQALGEFRHSSRAAAARLADGPADVRTWRLAYPRAYPASVAAATAANGVDPHLVWAIMRQESAFHPGATSRSGAQGLMQVMPRTWDWLAELQREAPGAAYDPSVNVRYGAFYLAWLLDYLEGDEELVIASYNRGQGYIRRLFEGGRVAGSKDDLYRWIDALETREYLQRVTVNRRVYDALYGPAR